MSPEENENEQPEVESQPEVDWEARAKAAEAARDKLKADAKARSHAEREAQRKAEEADAKSRGETEQLLARRDERVAELEAKLEAQHERDVARAQAKLERLPETARQKLEAFRGDLAPERFEALIDTELSAVSVEPLPPAMPIGGHRKPSKGRNEPLPGVNKLLDKMFIPESERRVFGHVGQFRDTDGTPKWGFHPDGDENRRKTEFIGMMTELARQGSDIPAAERIFK